MFAGLAAVAVVAGIYVMSGAPGNAPDAGSCQLASKTAERIDPLLTGQVAAMISNRQKIDVNGLTFSDDGGAEKTLKDYTGRVVLLNLWATWCAPCREEMPALDRLQAKLGGPDFEVVAINIDTRNPDRPKKFLNEVKIEHLAYYADPTMKVFNDLKSQARAVGLPTTMLVGRDGCEIATMKGPAVWDSDDAIKLIAATISKDDS
jgi:thiol-disulfide isomerase/thioredoxin